MKLLKKAGLWMDHSIANIIEFTQEPFKVITIGSEVGSPVNTIVIGEKRIHNKEHEQQKRYYKKLSEVISHYDQVILFGPTNAKTELFNILKEDHHFAHIKIEVKETDNINEKQQIAFVHDYFSKINNHA